MHIYKCMNTLGDPCPLTLIHTQTTQTQTQTLPPLPVKVICYSYISLCRISSTKFGLLT